MLKRALVKCGCIIKQPALKIHSTRAEESRNRQGMLVNNVEKSNKKKLNEYSLKFFSNLNNAKGILITRMIETWVTGKFHHGIFYDKDFLGLGG